MVTGQQQAVVIRAPTTWTMPGFGNVLTYRWPVAGTMYIFPASVDITKAPSADATSSVAITAGVDGTYTLTGATQTVGTSRSMRFEGTDGSRGYANAYYHQQPGGIVAWLSALTGTSVTYGGAATATLYTGTGFTTSRSMTAGTPVTGLTGNSIYRIFPTDSGAGLLFTTPPVTPGAVESATATANTATAVSVEWQPPTNAMPADVSGYEIESRGTSGIAASWVQVANLAASARSYQHTGLRAPGRAYHYRVRAISAGRQGPWTEVSATTTGNAVATPAIHTLTWSDWQTRVIGGFGGSSVTAAPKVTSSVAGTLFVFDGDTSGADAESTHLDTGATAIALAANTATAVNISTATGTKAQFRFEGVDGSRGYAARGVDYHEQNATFQITTTRHVQMQVSALGNRSVSFNLTTIGGAGAEQTQSSTTFSVYTPYTNDKSPTTHSGTSVTGLTPNTSYGIQTAGSAQSRNVGQPAPTLRLNLQTANVPLPNPVLGSSLRVTAISDSALTFVWAAPAAVGGVPITGYDIERYDAASSTWVAETTTTALTYTATGLASSTAYRFRIWSDSANGRSATATEITGTTSAAVPGPVINFARQAFTASSITLAWEAPADKAGVTLQGYRLQFRATPGAEWTTEADFDSLSASTLTYIDTGLTANTGYHYRIAAVDSNDALGPYSQLTAFTDEVRPPAVNDLAAAAITASSATLTWGAPTNPPIPVTGYQVDRMQGDGGYELAATITDPLALTYTDRNLAESTTYTYRVRANSANGLGVAAEVTLTTLAAPEPTALAPIPGDAQPVVPPHAPALRPPTAIYQVAVGERIDLVAMRIYGTLSDDALRTLIYYDPMRLGVPQTYDEAFSVELPTEPVVYGFSGRDDSRWYDERESVVDRANVVPTTGLDPGVGP